MSGAVADNPEDATGLVVRRSGHHLLQPQGKYSFNVHGRAWPAVLGVLFATAGLNACLLVGGDDGLIQLQGIALPLAGIQIE